MKLLALTGLILLAGGLFIIALVYQSNPSDFDSNFAMAGWVGLVLVALSIISFGIVRVNPPAKDAKVVAVAFLIISLMVPVAFTAGYLCLLPCMTTPPFPPVAAVGTSGTVIVYTGINSSALSLQVENDSGNMTSITAIDLTSLSLDNTTTLRDLSVNFTYHGNLVTAANPLPFGETALSTTNFHGATPGEICTISLTIVFKNGASAFQTFELAAQS